MTFGRRSLLVGFFVLFFPLGFPLTSLSPVAADGLVGSPVRGGSRRCLFPFHFSVDFPSRRVPLFSCVQIGEVERVYLFSRLWSSETLPCSGFHFLACFSSCSYHLSGLFLLQFSAFSPFVRDFFFRFRSRSARPDLQKSFNEDAFREDSPFPIFPDSCAIFCRPFPPWDSMPWSVWPYLNVVPSWEKTIALFFLLQSPLLFRVFPLLCSEYSPPSFVPPRTLTQPPQVPRTCSRSGRHVASGFSFFADSRTVFQMASSAFSDGPFSRNPSRLQTEASAARIHINLSPLVKSRGYASFRQPFAMFSCPLFLFQLFFPERPPLTIFSGATAGPARLQQI